MWLDVIIGVVFVGLYLAIGHRLARRRYVERYYDRTSQLKRDHPGLDDPYIAGRARESAQESSWVVFWAWLFYYPGRWIGNLGKALINRSELGFAERLEADLKAKAEAEEAARKAEDNQRVVEGWRPPPGWTP
jgi:hypothetical protein